MSETPNNDPKLDAVGNKIDDIQNKLQQAPTEEKDPKWLAGLNSALTTLQTEVAELRKAQGASPELAELMREITELKATIAELKTATPPQPPAQSLPPQSAAEESPSPATPPATSSEEKPATPPARTSAKEKGRRKPGWL